MLPQPRVLQHHNLRGTSTAIFGRDHITNNDTEGHCILVQPCEAAAAGKLACTTAVVPASRNRRYARKSLDSEMVQLGGWLPQSKMVISEVLSDWLRQMTLWQTVTILSMPYVPNIHQPTLTYIFHLALPVVSLGERVVSCINVLQAIILFPCGYAGDPDKLHPQHLKDLLQHAQLVGDEAPESLLLSALADFCDLVLHGETPEEVYKVFLFWCFTGGTEEESQRGRTLRWLAATVACKQVVDEMAELLAHRQLAYGVRGGSEAAISVALQFLNNIDACQAMVKLDFDALNSVRRNCMLEAVQSL